MTGIYCFRFRFARVEDHLRRHGTRESGESDELPRDGETGSNCPDLQRSSVSAEVERFGLLQMFQVMLRRGSGKKSSFTM